jgi:hypothetical protein
MGNQEGMTGEGPLQTHAEEIIRVSRASSEMLYKQGFIPKAPIE